MTGDDPVTAIVSATEPGFSVTSDDVLLTCKSSVAVAGAADGAAIAGLALVGASVTLPAGVPESVAGEAAVGRAVRGAMIGAAAGGTLAAGAAAFGSTFATSVTQDDDGRRSIPATTATARTATAALQAQRGRNQIDTEGPCTSAARRTAARCAGVS